MCMFWLLSLEEAWKAVTGGSETEGAQKRVGVLFLLPILIPTRLREFLVAASWVVRVYSLLQLLM